MQNRLFNSVFEMELRVLLLLSTGHKKNYTIERIVALDFIICYAECFQFPYENLHGDNNYMYGELSNRRFLATEAVKKLVTKGLAEVTVFKGYQFSVSDAGKKYAKALESTYAVEYQKIAMDVIKTFNKLSDEELDVSIRENAIRELGRK